MTLKPCPFCGKTEIAVLDANDIEELEPMTTAGSRPVYAALCNFNAKGCGATGGYRETPAAAAEVWNARS